MLKTLNTMCCRRIHEETGIPVDQIMAYVHYPPSVYQLHIHFKHPVGPHISHDTFRIHSLTSIINNLQIDSDYYAKSLLQMPVYPCTDLYRALGLEEAGDATDAAVMTHDATDPSHNKKCLKLSARPKKPEPTNLSNDQASETTSDPTHAIEKEQPHPATDTCTASPFRGNRQSTPAGVTETRLLLAT
jgi:hypothetical protein